MHEIIHNNINIDCTIRGKKTRILKHITTYHAMHTSLHKDIRKQKDKRKETH